jgi:hypothetical protein
VGGPTKGKSGAPEEEGALRTSAVPRMASVVAEQGPVATDQVEGRASERDPRLPLSVMNRAGVMSGGTTTAAKRRQRRAEGAVAAAQGILAAEVRERREERAKLLRVVAGQVIAEVRELEELEQRRHEHRAVQIATAAVKKATRATAQHSHVITGRPATPEPEVATLAGQRTGAEWQAAVQQFDQFAPMELPTEGALTALRTARRQALKEAKKFRVAKREKRLLDRQHQRQTARMDELSGRAAWARKRQPQKKKKYRYDRQGRYGEVELRATPDGKRERVAQLRAAGSGSPDCWPTALLALTKTHTQEIRLDTCAQFSVAGVALRKYGRCMTRDVPVDVVEGFGGGRCKVLGVWRFRGTTVYRQTIFFDALLVEGQGDELLLGEDWMVERQVMLNFGNRELKYRDEKGHKVILPFTYHGISSLQRPGDAPTAMVRLAKTVKLTANPATW